MDLNYYINYSFPILYFPFFIKILFIYINPHTFLIILNIFIYMYHLLKQYYQNYLYFTMLNYS